MIYILQEWRLNSDGMYQSVVNECGAEGQMERCPKAQYEMTPWERLWKRSRVDWVMS